MSFIQAVIFVTLLSQSETSATAYGKAEAAFENLEFDVAAKAYQKALKAPGSLKQRIGTFRGLGVSLAAMGDLKGSRAAFQNLLLLDPQATIDESLGPKVTKPFQQARQALGDKHNRLTLEREIGGEVLAFLHEDVPLAESYELHAREVGGEWQVDKAKAYAQLKLPFDPEKSVEAWALAKDAFGGELYFAGSETAPLKFLVKKETLAPTKELAQAAPAVDFKVDKPTEKPSHPWWPYVAGGAAVAVATTVVVLFLPPQKVNLPAASQTVNLP